MRTTTRATTGPRRCRSDRWKTRTAPTHHRSLRIVRNLKTAAISSRKDRPEFQNRGNTSAQPPESGPTSRIRLAAASTGSGAAHVRPLRGEFRFHAAASQRGQASRAQTSHPAPVAQPCARGSKSTSRSEVHLHNEVHLLSTTHPAPHGGGGKSHELVK